MPENDLEKIALRNVRSFTLFRVFFSARFYYPVYALIFLDYGLTLEQFGLLNAIWATTIVLSEVPSGALADTIGRRNLLIATGVLMILEMGVLLLAPIDGGALLFGLFMANRIISGLAEAAASGADEALTYDSLKAAGMAERWGHILERVQRDTSLAFFFAMMIGAAVYDPDMVNSVFAFLGFGLHVDQSDLVKMPILLTFISGIVVLMMAIRMREAVVEKQGGLMDTVRQSGRNTLAAGKWIWVTALPFGIILAIMALDNVIRQFLTLASEYWRVIGFPIASFGLILAGMSLLGVFVPRLARIMADRLTPLKNFLIMAGLVFVGLVGLSFVVPYWGILPAILLYVDMGMMNYLFSRYINEAAPSEQRATVLSFRGLSTNVAYGAVCLFYSLLIAGIKGREDIAAIEEPSLRQETVFIESLGWFPWYFLVTILLVFVTYRIRFSKKGVFGN